MRYILSFLLILFATNQISMAGIDPQQFNNANKLYLSHEYDKAIALYNSIDIANPDLEYNRASAYFKADKIGKAILHLNRALKLRPGDEDAIANLRYMKSIKQDREKEREAGYIENVAVVIANALPINQMTTITAILYLISALGALSLILGNKNRRAKMLVWLILFALLTTASAGLTYHRIDQFETTDRAIAIERSINAYSGPSDITDRLFTFHEGTEVTIGRVDGAYAFVTLSSGLSGWTKIASLERI